MKKKWITLLSFVMVLTIFATGCSTGTDSNSGSSVSEAESGNSKGSSDEKTYTIKVADYYAESHPQNVALRKKFKTMVEQNSNGTLKVEIYPNSELGAEKEFYNGVRNGTIEMGVPGTIMETDVPRVKVVDLPFLFDTVEEARSVYQGEIGDWIVENFEKKQGVVPLAFTGAGFRMFSSNRTINSLENFEGLSLRMPTIPVYIQLGKLLGANVTPMAFSEVFTGLQQGVIDGQDNPIATLRASGWYEAQSDVLESRHIFTPNIYVMNADFWNKLSSEQQKVVQEAAKVTADYEWELIKKSYEEDKRFLQENGIKFTNPSSEFKTAMREAVQPIYDDFYEQYDWGKDIVDKIEAATE